MRIATQIVADAYRKNCDVAIVVSADSDMIPAIELAIEARQKVFIYLFPSESIFKRLGFNGRRATYAFEAL